MGEEAEEQWLWGWGARADENGFFSIDGLAAGTYQIELSDPNGVYAVEVYEDALNSGEGIDLEVMAGGTAWADPVLERGGRVYGQVVDANGEGIANVMVMFDGWRRQPTEGGGWEWYGDALDRRAGRLLVPRVCRRDRRSCSSRTTAAGTWASGTTMSSIPARATPVDVARGVRRTTSAASCSPRALTSPAR